MSLDSNRREPAGKIARRLAERYKFKPIPVARGAKTAVASGWPELATSDPDAAEALFSVYPEDCNVGIHLGTELFALDFDVKKGGMETMQYLDMMEGLPPTLTTLTANGGRHKFYRLPANHPGVANGVDVLGPGADVRGNHGYVVAPGSVLEGGKRYTFEAETALIADAPQWLLDRLAAYVPRERKTGSVMDVPDAPEATVEQALAWLRTAERSVKGSGGDQAAYRVACQLRDRGLSYAQACDALRSDAWDHGCGWRENRLEEKPIRSAYRYAQGEAGAKGLTDADFAAPIVPGLGYGEISNAPPPPCVISGFLPQACVTILNGPPGEIKTGTALDLAHAIGSPSRSQDGWMGRKVKHGLVVYIPFEGLGGVRKRLLALQHQYADRGEAVALRILHPDDIGDPTTTAGRTKLEAVLQAVRDAYPGKELRAIVFDTVSQMIANTGRDIDENKASQVAPVLRQMTILAENTKAAVVLIHHTGKDATKGSRGSSAFRGNVDQEITIERESTSSKVRVISPIKMRDLEPFEPFLVQPISVPLGVDEDGEPYSSFVVMPAAGDVTKGSWSPGSRLNRCAWEALYSLGGLGNEPVERKDLHERFVAKAYPSGDVEQKTAGKALTRALDTFIESGKVAKTPDGRFARVLDSYAPSLEPQPAE